MARVVALILAYFFLALAMVGVEALFAGEATNLTNSNSDDRYPTWSPDGETVLFESNRAGNWDVYQMKRNGSNLLQITESDRDERFSSLIPKTRYYFRIGHQARVSWHTVWIQTAQLICSSLISSPGTREN